MHEYENLVRVKWNSDREFEIALALGYRVAGGVLESLVFGPEGDEAWIKGVRPADDAHVRAWVLLVKGENNWNRESVA